MAKGQAFEKIKYLAIFFPLLVGLTALGSVTAIAASTPDKQRAEIMERAQKEGKVVWYTTMSLQSSDVMRRRFEAKYPFLKMDIIRLSDEKLINRAINEARGRAYLVDVFQCQALSTELLVKEGLLERYTSPESQYYPDGMKDKEGYWTSIYMNAKGIGYNTKMVAAKDAPKTWYDLLDPKWKGQLLMDTGDFEWYANMMKIWGREKGLDFMKRLADMKSHYRTGHTLEAQLIAAGEYPVAPVLNIDRVEEMRLTGAPLKFVAADPTIARFHPIALAKNSPHPNGSKLFIDFSLSVEGQKILAETLRAPARPGVESFVSASLKGVKLYYADTSLESQYKEIMREYKEIFRQR